MKSLPQRFENENDYVNEIYLINSFGQASPRFRFEYANRVGAGPGSGVATPRITSLDKNDGATTTSNRAFATAPPSSGSAQASLEAPRGHPPKPMAPKARFGESMLITIELFLASRSDNFGHFPPGT